MKDDEYEYLPDLDLSVAIVNGDTAYYYSADTGDEVHFFSTLEDAIGWLSDLGDDDDAEVYLISKKLVAKVRAGEP